MEKRMISFEISDAQREALRVMAFQRSVSVSELIRQILAEVCPPKKQEVIANDN